MYKNNSRDSSKFKVCNPQQRRCGSTGNDQREFTGGN
jgi:hypothetical protein